MTKIWKNTAATKKYGNVPLLNQLGSWHQTINVKVWEYLACMSESSVKKILITDLMFDYDKSKSEIGEPGSESRVFN